MRRASADLCVDGEVHGRDREHRCDEGDAATGGLLGRGPECPICQGVRGAPDRCFATRKRQCLEERG